MRDRHELVSDANAGRNEKSQGNFVDFLPESSRFVIALCVLRVATMMPAYAGRLQLVLLRPQHVPSTDLLL